MSYIIPRNILAAVALCAAKKDIRFYLKTVYLDPQGFAVATDGHVLAYGKITPSGPVSPALLASSDVEFLLKTYPKAAHFAIDAKANTWECNGRITPMAEGTFPDWQRVVPREVSGVTANYDAELQAMAVKVRKAYGPSKIPGMIKLFQNGTDAGVYRIADDLHMIIMPLRDNAPVLAGKYEPLI